MNNYICGVQKDIFDKICIFFLPKILHLASWGANITTYPRSDVICFKEWLIYVNSSVTCIIIIDVCSVQKWCLLSKYTNFDKNDTFAHWGAYIIIYHLE